MIEIYDIETIINLFVFCSEDRSSDKKYRFIIHKNCNQLLELINHLKNIVSKQIGYNNLSFDSQVVQYILNNYNNWLNLNGEEVSNLIYKYAQKTIELSNSGKFPQYPEWKLIIPQMDLFKIFHYDNKNKMTSLKWLEFMLDIENIQEMPYKHYQRIETSEEIEEIVSYCFNDIKASKLFYNITIGNTNNSLYKGVNKVQLRKDIELEFGINCINYNDVKIGDALNKLNYCRIKGIDKKDIPRPNKIISNFTFKDCFPNYIEFKTDKFNNFIKAISNIQVNLKKEKGNKKQEFQLEYNGTNYIIARGGLHSQDKARLVKPLENEILRDADVGGMYPRAIDKRELFPRHLGKEWLIGYRDIIEKRAVAKKKFKETKESKYQAIQEAYKLSNNGGGFGKTNEENSWQYDPFVTYSTTIGSQIDLLMLIESLELSDIHVISANTDGIICLFDKFLENTYYKVCKEWELKVGNNILGQLEYTDYKLFVQTSVNDYIAVKNEGEIKTKGDFTSEFELHKNKSAKVVPLALQQYFINNVKPEEFIEKHTNIFDFCLGVKSIGKNKLISFNKEEQIEIELQKINRYYISNKGIHLLKRLPKLDNKKAKMQIDIFGNVDDGTRESEIEASWLSTVYNKHIQKDIKEYDICYKYYLDRIWKIINKIKN